MRLHLLLPKVEPKEITPPSTCANPKCQGRKFRFHQPVSKALRDTIYHEVQAHRYQCLKCGRTFRVYPQGVSSAHTSLRSEPSAGGSKNAIAVCGATKSRRMRCGSAASSPGVATSSTRVEQTWLSLAGSQALFSRFPHFYQSSNGHNSLIFEGF